MLSILIPLFNYNILPLVEEIHLQASACNIIFEIIIIDDASSEQLTNIEKVKSYSNTKIIINTHNIGRSAIRNLLVTRSSYNNLLFIDAGTFPKTSIFIANYLEVLDQNITIGGMVEEKLAPKKPYKLRWLYAKKKLASCNKKNTINTPVLSSANFLIKKSIIQTYPFDESIKKYGFEDSIFFENLKLNSFQIKFIKNPVIHDSKEDAVTFIIKIEDGLKNLVLLSKDKRTLVDRIKIFKVQSKLRSLGLSGIIIFLFRKVKPLLIRNFSSSNPSIFLLDFYKLGYLSDIISKEE